MNGSDLSTRIIAVALALFLWAYVRIAQETPETQRLIRDVPIKINVASSWAARLAPGDNTVDIYIEGPSKRVNDVLRESIVATVDLTEATDARTRQYPITIPDLPRGVKLVRNLPRVTITTFPLERKTLMVTVSLIAQPPPGTTMGAFLLAPDTVTVEGQHEAISQVKYVTVPIDPAEPLTVERDLVPRPVSSTGERVNDVRVLTSTIKVRMASLTGQQVTRQVAVRPPALRSLPRRFSVTVSKVRPDEVMLSGESSLLERQPAYLETEPIDVHALTKDTTRTTRLRVPNGLTIVEGSEVRVDLEVHPIE